MHVYKQNRNRSVLLDDSGSPPCVVKRFHHTSPWRALRDAARARGEFRALERLGRLGLPVPSPLELRLGTRPASFSMQAILGARSLEALLLGGEPPVPWPQLMASLATLLARLQELRVAAPDLHPGNVLVDPKGQLFLVDLRGTRVRWRAFNGAHKFGALVAAAAEARDYLPENLRTRFLVAWKRASGHRDALDLRLLESRSMLLRRAYVQHGAGRWLRQSSRCDEERGPLGTRYTSKWNPGFQSAAACEDTPLIHEEGSSAEVRQTWLNAARCVEHRLPVAWPLSLELGAQRARATYAAASSPGIELENAGAQGMQRFEELFRSRGLELGPVRKQDLLQTRAGGLLLRPPRRLINIHRPA